MATPIELQAIEDLRAMNPGDDSFLRELIQIYLEDSPQRIAEIEQSLAQGDAVRLTRAAHSLKGSSSNFGATQLRAVSERIERLGHSGVLNEVAAQMPELKTEFDRVKAALEALVPPAGA
jgi:HPt (histidine-containing phosphotransfer) domain-containing protein